MLSDSSCPVVTVTALLNSARGERTQLTHHVAQSEWTESDFHNMRRKRQIYAFIIWEVKTEMTIKKVFKRYIRLRGAMKVTVR